MKDKTKYWEIAVKSESPCAILHVIDPFFGKPLEKIHRWSLPYGDYEVVTGIDGSLTEEEAVRRAFSLLADEFILEFCGKE